jgi:uncharacterized lipoprotein YddW (UPF0748 family)
VAFALIASAQQARRGPLAPLASVNVMHIRRLAPPPIVPREFRAAWATPIWDRGFRDWPSVAGLTPDSQRAELRALLDHAVSIGLNAVILHVRLAGDALYPSSYAPWSSYLTGVSGRAPSPEYDPLAYAVDQAHARGLQLHAWFNPFRAMLPLFAGRAAKTHVTKAHPEWVRKYGTQTWIDPGDPAARRYVLETMLDVVKRYDIDGVHIDDYFYPYRESRTVVRRVHGRRVRGRVDIEFPDARTWTKYGKPKGYASRDAWRRANIDDFVQSLYRGVKAIRPTVLVGIAPFGIWRSGTPDGVRGLDAYDEIYADSRRWLAEGWLDYIAPQLYWPLDGEDDRFRALNAWWRSENRRDRYVWPALYTSHVYGGRDPWPLAEIGDEIEVLRRSSAATAAPPGHVHFRLAALFADGDRLASTLADMYRDRALVPGFPWLGATAPAAPVVTIDSSDGGARFTVVPGDSTRVRWWLVQTMGRDGVWLTTLRPVRDGRIAAAAFGTAYPSEVAVTAISSSGMASSATLIAP